MSKVIVVREERSYGFVTLVGDLVLGFLTCGIWWIIRLFWFLARR